MERESTNVPQRFIATILRVRTLVEIVWVDLYSWKIAILGTSKGFLKMGRFSQLQTPGRLYLLKQVDSVHYGHVHQLAVLILYLLISLMSHTFQQD